jgi:hypothetical protein
MGNWATKRGEMAYEVVVWSISDQRVVDLIGGITFADGLMLVNQIKSEDPDLNAWVKSFYRKAEEKAA